MTLLICEGACNPSLPDFDEAALAYAEQLSGSGVTLDVLNWLTHQRTLLQHTQHSHLWRNRYACGVCGCERQYGPKDWAMDKVEQLV